MHGSGSRRGTSVELDGECFREFGFERLDAHLLHDLTEEARHDEAASFFFVDATRLQVEQLLIVEATGGTCVSGTLDVTSLNLEVRDRICARARRENQVSVCLVRVGARCVWSDKNVAYPNGPCALTLQSALVEHVTLGV